MEKEEEEEEKKKKKKRKKRRRRNEDSSFCWDLMRSYTNRNYPKVCAKLQAPSRSELYVL